MQPGGLKDCFARWLGFRVSGSGFRAFGKLGFRVWGSGFRAFGKGFGLVRLGCETLLVLRS